jgi:hypothetical protein
MKNWHPERRELLRLLASLPVGLAVGSDLEQEAAAEAALTSAEESLAALIRLLGPWPDSERRVAERFARRFLEAPHAVAPYLPDAAEVGQSLARRFRGEPSALKEVDLRELPDAERELLLRLVKQLYSFIEVRFLVAGDPPYGECQSDRMLHTRAPGTRVET